LYLWSEVVETGENKGHLLELPTGYWSGSWRTLFPVSAIIQIEIKINFQLDAFSLPPAVLLALPLINLTWIFVCGSHFKIKTRWKNIYITVDSLGIGHGKTLAKAFSTLIIKRLPVL